MTTDLFMEFDMTTDDDIIEGLRMLHEATQSGLREQMGLTSEWLLRSLPNMPREYFDELMEVIGSDNVRLVSLRSDNQTGKEIVAGSVFLNDQARANLRAFKETFNA